MNITKLFTIGFTVLIASFMAVTSFAFGYNNITIFGDSIASRAFGASWALLISDVAVWVWYFGFKQPEQTKAQRRMAIFMMVVAFIMSLVFTVAQLTLTTGLGDYLDKEGIGFGAYIVIILVTVIMAITLQLYGRFSVQNEIDDAIADASSEALTDALSEAKKRVKADKPIIVGVLAGTFHNDILGRIGFTGDLQLIVNGKNKPIEGNIVTANKDTQPMTVELVATPTTDNKTAMGAVLNRVEQDTGVTELSPKIDAYRYHLSVGGIYIAQSNNLGDLQNHVAQYKNREIEAYIYDTKESCKVYPK